MSFKLSNRSLLAGLAFGLTVTALTGCSNMGNENPISPQDMAEGRKQDTADRANFKPPASTAPPTTTTGG